MSDTEQSDDRVGQDGAASSLPPEGQQTAELLAPSAPTAPIDDQQTAAPQSEQHGGVGRLLDQPGMVRDFKAAQAPGLEPPVPNGIRFEMGTIHDLMTHMKDWVEWRLRQGGQ